MTSAPASSTRMRVSRAGLCDVGTLVQPAAGATVTWSYCRLKAWIRFGRSLGETKLVVTPRPERNDRKSTVGPLMTPLRPPAHSIWRTFLPPRSADWAIVSACSTPAPNELVEFANGWLLVWNVLLVEPCTPGQAPVAIVYHPAPVLGGAWVSMPPPLADAPLRRSSAKPGTAECRPRSFAYRSTTSCRRPSAANSRTESSSRRSPPPPCPAACGSATAVAATTATTALTTTPTRRPRSLRTPGSLARRTPGAEPASPGYPDRKSFA